MLQDYSNIEAEIKDGTSIDGTKEWIEVGASSSCT